MLLSRYSAGKRSKTLENSRSSPHGENEKNRCKYFTFYDSVNIKQNPLLCFPSREGGFDSRILLQKSTNQSEF